MKTEQSQETAQKQESTASNVTPYAPGKGQLIEAMIKSMDAITTRQNYAHALILGRESYRQLLQLIEEGKDPRIAMFGFIRHPFPVSFFGVTIVCDPAREHYVCALPSPLVVMKEDIPQCFKPAAI